MAMLSLLRHGPTDWNAAGRLQGRSDIPLSAAGRRLAEAWRLPAAELGSDWVASPLRRCRETAALLRHSHGLEGDVRIEPRLIEMSFGDWEGRSLPELRTAHGAAMAEWEGRGLDFRAPGGESPRDVQDRLRPWLAQVADSPATLAITHKGVIRALYALASGWDMRDKPPCRLAEHALHRFVVDGSRLHVDQINIPILPGDAAAETP